MIQLGKKTQGGLSVCKLLQYALYVGLYFAAGLVTVGAIRLTAEYFAYFDIGVNAGANAFELLFVMAPLLLLAQLTVVTTLVAVARRRNLAGWVTVFVVLAGILLVGVASVVIQVWCTIDYPGPLQKNPQEFWRMLQRLG